jgi:hypothetical protein
MAVPALPRNRLAWRTGSAPPRPVTDTVPCAPLPHHRAAQRRQGIEHDAGVVGVQQVVYLCGARTQRPAAARGWKCFWSRAAPPCRRPPAAGAGRGREWRTWNQLSGTEALALGSVHALRASLAWLYELLQRLARRCACMQASSASSAARNWADCASTSARLASRMSRHTAGSEAAMRVKSRKPGSCQRQKLARLRLRRDGVHGGKSHQVGQVAHGSVSGVVGFGCHVAHAAAQCPPHLLGAGQVVGPRFGQWRQNHLAVLVQARVGMAHASHFAPGNGVGWHKARQLLAQHAARGSHNVGFGGAHIHDQCVGAQQVPYGFEGVFRSRHGHRQQHNVGPRHRQQRGRRFHVNHAHLARQFRGGGRLAVAHHALHQPSLLQGQRERAPHEAAPNEPKLLEHGFSPTPGRRPAPCSRRTGH